MKAADPQLLFAVEILKEFRYSLGSIPPPRTTTIVTKKNWTRETIYTGKVVSDFEIQRCTRHCAVTGRELRPGEVFYSVLIADSQGWRRIDYSAEAWHGPPNECIAWWRTQLPSTSQKKRCAPSEVMLRLLEQLADRPDQADMRYVLALFMVRRRVLRLEGSQQTEDNTEILTLFCPRNDTTYQVPVVLPSEERLQQLEEQIANLLEGEENEALAAGTDPPGASTKERKGMTEST